ncbi:MAG TPA: mycofactocin biosynthesis peptidyl-dipeptidase MftE [Solirubrobacteraceae bacterium]|nr:mycofactocin biosynthesis peptidyl-dipeptidase MftE [Solirubrobacteraceae bacterium]
MERLTWPDLDGRRVLLAVPVGATEQHGPHLPLATDTLIARSLTERLAAARADLVAGPALAYGASGEHEGFPGTVSIGAEALERCVVELVRSATRWAAGVVLVNAHGGNLEALAAARRRLEAEGRGPLVFSPPPVGDAHAGRTETSLLLALAPELVVLERAVAGATAPLRSLLAELRARGVRPVSPTGVLGYPAGASAALGEQLLERWLADLLAAVAEWSPR